MLFFLCKGQFSLQAKTQMSVTVVVTVVCVKEERGYNEGKQDDMHNKLHSTFAHI